jgi:hypothetical protein
MQKMLRVPANMQAVRYKPPMEVPVPEGMETPFISPDDPASKQIQQVWKARVKVFNMGDAKEVEEYEKVWQMACDGRGHVSESRTEFNKELGTYLVFCRWSEISLVLPAIHLPPGTVQAAAG